MIYKFFSHSVGCFFTFLMVYFEEKFLILMMSYLFFLLLIMLLVSDLRNHCLIQRQRIYTYFFQRVLCVLLLCFRCLIHFWVNFYIWCESNFIGASVLFIINFLIHYWCLLYAADLESFGHIRDYILYLV